MSEGRAFASFGEIVQGRLSNGEDFLVTLPVDLWSHCRLISQSNWELSKDSFNGPQNGNGSKQLNELSDRACGTPNIVETEFSKSKAIALALLEHFGQPSDQHIQLIFNRNIPIGKGLSSSTADMLAVVRAFEAQFEVILSPGLISELFTAIEPHDALHYPSCVAYNHRQGRLLQAFDYIPDFQIIGIDAGGVISTQEYNKHLSFSDALLKQYDDLYAELLEAFARSDDAAIALCAQQSALIHSEQTNNALLKALLNQADELTKLGTMGVLATHSGTCAGILLPGTATEAELMSVKKRVAQYGSVFQTKTLVATSGNIPAQLASTSNHSLDGSHLT
jgi:L-threonine kinase